MLVTYHDTVPSKVLQQSKELWTQAVSGFFFFFFYSKGLKATFALMNEPLLELHGSKA